MKGRKSGSLLSLVIAQSWTRWGDSSGTTWMLKVDADTMKIVWKTPTQFELIDDENHGIVAVRK